MLSEITSPKTPRVKRWKDLVRDPALRREAGLFPVDGEHMVREALGAGNVVTRSIPPHSLAVGNPCRVIRTIGEQDRMV